MSYMGIDPGKSGGLVRLWPSGVVSVSTPMPPTRLEVWQWIDRYKDHDTVAMIEKVQAFPDQGRSSCFTFGQGYGELLMALTAAGIPTETVHPKAWQRGVGMIRKKNEPNRQWKERLRGKAQELFPSLPIWSEPRTKGKQLAIADALLIAWWCRRVNH